MMTKSSEYSRLMTLNQRVKNNTANKAEKDELFELLYKHGHISKKQYEDYQKGRNIEDVVNAAVVIAGIVLLGHILGQIGNA